MSDFPKLDLRPNPKLLAIDFLRYQGVQHNDLITGDHAAELLAKWTLIMTDWGRRWDEMELIREWRMLSPVASFKVESGAAIAGSPARSATRKVLETDPKGQ